MATTKKPVTGEPETQKVVISAPKFQTVSVKIVGTAPYVQHKFSAKAREQIIATQMAGSQARSRKAREAKDFDSVYEGAIHRAEEGWIGFPAGCIRNAMISACRTVGFKMTHAKLAVFVEADGYEQDDGTPLVRISGEPFRHTTWGRNDNGSVDIRVRPMWKSGEWSAVLRLRFDQDMLSLSDVMNLLVRVGMQVGIGEGRADSRNSAGLGWGFFAVESEAMSKAA